MEEELDRLGALHLWNEQEVRIDAFIQLEEVLSGSDQNLEVAALIEELFDQRLELGWLSFNEILCVVKTDKELLCALILREVDVLVLLFLLDGVGRFMVEEIDEKLNRVGGLIRQILKVPTVIVVNN